MKKIKLLAVAAFLICGAWSGATAAQQGPSLSCTGSNFCLAYPGGIAYDRFDWSFDTGGTDALFPSNCTNSNVCAFYCPNSPGVVVATVTYSLEGRITGSATSSARCTAQPI